jgi:streptogramin lyase
MKTRYLSTAAALTAAVVLSACGGGSTTPASFLPAPQPSQSTGGSATAEAFQIAVPAKSGVNSVRITVQTVNGAPSPIPPTIAPIGTSAPGCTADSSGNLSCTVKTEALTGADVFAVSTYQSTDGSGTALASTTVAENVASGTNGPVALALGGVAASIAFSPSILPLQNDGGIHRYAETLNAVDASGRTIVGATPYRYAIALQILNDPTHALALSTASITQPGTVVTITYDSSKSLVDATIQASGTSVQPATLNAAPINASPFPVLIYDDQTNGLPVTLSQAGFAGTFTASLANAQDGSVSVVQGALQSGSSVATIIPHTTFDVTTLSVNNGAYPTPAKIPVTIVPHNGQYAAFGKSHQFLSPSNMVEGPDGRLWVGDSYTGTLNVFDPSSGSYKTYSVDPSDQGPRSIAFDTSGNIWFADGTQIGEFTPGTTAVAMYSSGLETSPNVTTIVRGPNGTMWYYDYGANNALHSGSPTYFGSIATNGQITFYPTNNAAEPALGGVMSMVLGSDNTIWFADGHNGAVGQINPMSGSITEYKLSSAANAPAYPTQAPMQVTNGPDGHVWFASFNSYTGASTIGSVDPNAQPAVTLSGVTPGGLMLALTAGSDGNLWFVEDQSAGFGYSSYVTFGVVNPNTKAIYQYPSITPEFTAFNTLIDRGDRTLWMLDTGFGQIGKVTFK